MKRWAIAGLITWNLLVLSAMVLSPRGPGLIPRAWGVGGGSFLPRADFAIGGVPVQIGAANAARVALVCTNNNAAINARVGNAAVAVAVGVRLPAGGSITITATPAIFAISEGAGIVVSCTEEQL